MFDLLIFAVWVADLFRVNYRFTSTESILVPLASSISPGTLSSSDLDQASLHFIVVSLCPVSILPKKNFCNLQRVKFHRNDYSRSKPQECVMPRHACMVLSLTFTFAQQMSARCCV